MIEITVNGETGYEEIEAYVSLDEELTQMEDTDQPPFYVSNGKAFKFSITDEGWCTRCLIYLMVSVKNEAKYFLDPVTYSAKNQLTDSVTTRMIVDQGT